MSNKNDIPLTEIDKRIPLSNFEHRDYFKKIGTLFPNRDKERIELKEVEKDFLERKELIYLFVVEGFIQKIGSSTSTMQGRIDSYNCGRQKARNKGTCSTTNYFVLQTFLNINKDIEVYAFFPQKKRNKR